MLAAMHSEPEIPHLERLIQTTRADCQSWELVRSLCDDVGPRFPCTPGDVAAIAWAQETFRRVGLAHVRAEPAEATLWHRGDESCTLLLPRKQPVALTALGGSVGTPPGGIEADVIEFTSLDALDAAPAGEVAGKVVYLHHVMPRLRDGTGYNMGSVVRTSGPSRAAKKGAIACLVRSVGTDSWRAAHTGALWYDPGAPPIPAAALSIPDADMLHRSIAAGAKVRTVLSLGCSPLPVGESANVVGEIPGTDRADEIVLLGAHLDSWDLGTGALDDGAGCGIAIDVARLIGALPSRPRRTVRVALFANEELGSGGGRAYASAHAAEASRHVIAMEADQGDGKPWALRVPADGRDGPVTRALQHSLAPLGIELDPGVSRGGVDIQPLANLGVPFVDLRQDATRYFDFHHTANDVIENVSRTDIAQTTLAFAVAVWVLANTDARYPTRGARP
ncbi:Aminopeptidase [Minicystis rosea]|nr:Aminopeptidase [Minicystis rosea]